MTALLLLMAGIALCAFVSGFAAATWLILRDDVPQPSEATREQLRALARAREADGRAQTRWSDRLPE